MSCGCFTRRNARDGENGDVIVLAEGLRGLRYFIGGFSGKGGGALKSEEFAGFGAGFEHSVRQQGQALAFGERKGGFRVRCIRVETQRQPVFKPQFLPVYVRREMAGVGHC